VSDGAAVGISATMGVFGSRMRSRGATA
jgi:hypothetical protein